MSEFLVVRLAENPAEASWLILSDQGHRLSRAMSGPLAAAVAESRERNVFLLVPGLAAVSTRVSLPVNRRSRIQQMLPYTLEDAVAEDVDTLHFAAGPRRDDGTMPVAVVARDLVTAWVAQCAEAGLTVDAIFVDVQGVPETPSNLTLLLENRKIYGRLPDREPFVFADLSLDELIEVLSTEADPSAYLKNIVVYADDEGYRVRESELQRVREHASSVEVTVLPDGVLARLAATLVTAPGANLLQGSFRVASNWIELLRPWRLPAMLVIALAVTATVVQAGRYFLLTRDDQALTAVLESNCQSAFATANLSACDSEMRSRLAMTGADVGADGKHGLLEALASVAAARNEQILIQALSFRDGVTNLRVTAPDVESLDRLAQALGSDGRFQASIQSTAPGDRGIEGRLQIAELRR